MFPLSQVCKYLIDNFSEFEKKGFQNVQEYSLGEIDSMQTLNVRITPNTTSGYQIRMHFLEYIFEHKGEECRISFAVRIRTDDISKLHVSYFDIAIAESECETSDFEICRELSDSWNYYYE